MPLENRDKLRSLGHLSFKVLDGGALKRDNLNLQALSELSMQSYEPRPRTNRFLQSLGRVQTSQTSKRLPTAPS